jgi:hypothetical protein
LNRRLLIAVCVAFTTTVAFAAPSGEAKAYPVSVKVPRQASTESFMSHQFKEIVTCTRACTVTSSVVIRASVAKRLGFENVAGKLVLIATNKGTLKPQTPTGLWFVLTRQARQHLGKAASTVAIFGSVRSVPKSRPTVNYSVGWSSKLT